MHQQYTTTLKQMVGRVLSIKPPLPPTLATDFINDSIRVLMDRKPNWSGLIKFTSVYVPPPINAGSVSMVQGSDNITVSGTTWPVDDVVNTTIPATISRTGLQVVVPASMDGIDVDTLLYVDSSGNPEIVAVKSVTSTSFMAKFTKFHNPGCTITSSSLANRQLKLGATYPIYTIRAVTSTTTATIDRKWLAANLNNGYQIVRLYYTIDPGLKSLISMVDQSQGIPPLGVNMPVQYLDRVDPQRTAMGYPQIFASKGPDANGNMQYELWPSPQSARQLTCTYVQQPPQMIADDDFLPDFVNPAVVFQYAASMAWNTKVGVDDIYFDPQVSRTHYDLFERGFAEMCKADDEKSANGVQWSQQWNGIGGANWNQSHSIDAIMYGQW